MAIIQTIIPNTVVFITGNFMRIKLADINVDAPDCSRYIYSISGANGANAELFEIQDDVLYLLNAPSIAQSLSVTISAQDFAQRYPAVSVNYSLTVTLCPTDNDDRREYGNIVPLMVGYGNRSVSPYYSIDDEDLDIIRQEFIFSPPILSDKLGRCWFFYVDFIIVEPSQITGTFYDQATFAERIPLYLILYDTSVRRVILSKEVTPYDESSRLYLWQDSLTLNNEVYPFFYRTYDFIYVSRCRSCMPEEVFIPDEPEGVDCFGPEPECEPPNKLSRRSYYNGITNCYCEYWKCIEVTTTTTTTTTCPPFPIPICEQGTEIIEVYDDNGCLRYDCVTTTTTTTTCEPAPSCPAGYSLETIDNVGGCPIYICRKICTDSDDCVFYTAVFECESSSYPELCAENYCQQYPLFFETYQEAYDYYLNVATDAYYPPCIRSSQPGNSNPVITSVTFSCVDGFCDTNTLP